jgi:cytosine/uracil/thiamine/allantoin permease
MDKMRNRSTDGRIETLFLPRLKSGTTQRRDTLDSGKSTLNLQMITILTLNRIAAAVNSSAWSLGSSNLANGLTAGEAIGMVFIGSFIAGLIAFVCGEPGVSFSTLEL